MKKYIINFLLLVLIFHLSAQQPNVVSTLSIDAEDVSGEIDLTKYSLGQGGLSPEPMIDAHLPQLQNLHPKTIRFFIQEYFNIYPAHGKYHWDILDKTLDAIVATGAQPIADICFKPVILFPKIDENIVVPTSYTEWDNLVTELVKHCKIKGYGIVYWELGNEPDYGEAGGCPYKFTPENYLVFYKHTSAAVLKADPTAKVGGPGLGSYRSAIGDSLISYCGKGNAPLDFFSWHGYSDNTYDFRWNLRKVKGKLGKYPSLKNTETIITEWNGRIFDPNPNPNYQPAFVLEMTNMFHEEGLSAAAYYHIRDAYIDPVSFKFLTDQTVEDLGNMFNITPYFGIFDNQGRVRPTYYVFKCLSLMKGSQLAVKGMSGDVKALSVKSGKWINTLFWNFPAYKLSGKESEFILNFSNVEDSGYRVIRITTNGSCNNLVVTESGRIKDLKDNPLKLTLAPYEIVWVEIRP